MFFREILMFRRKKFLNLKCYLSKEIIFSIDKVNIKMQCYIHKTYPSKSLFQEVLKIFNRNFQYKCFSKEY